MTPADSRDPQLQTFPEWRRPGFVFASQKSFCSLNNHMAEKNQTRVVYTTGIGRVCPGCGKPAESCICRKQATQRPAGDGIIRIRRETKGRNGKGVTVITGVPLGESELQTLGKQLKARCGTGGTVKDGNIEIQGDHRDLILTELTKLGWTVKKAGG